MELSEKLRWDIEKKIMEIIRRDFQVAVSCIDLIKNNVHDDDTSVKFYKSIISVKNTNIDFILTKEILIDLEDYLSIFVKLLEEDEVKNIFNTLDSKLLENGTENEIIEFFKRELENCRGKIKK